MADPRRKIQRSKNDILGNICPTSPDFDPLYFVTSHPKWPAIIDLNCFSTGLKEENIDARTRHISEPFRARPKLILELSQAIRAQSANYSKKTASGLMGCLRWWWRFLDRIDALCPSIEGVADFNEIHYSAYRLDPCKNGIASLFFRILDYSRQLQNYSNSRREILIPLNWVAVAKPTLETNLVSQNDVQRVYNHLKRRAFSILALYDLEPERVPTKPEIVIFFNLFILKTGWNPSTAFDLDVTLDDSKSDLKCIDKHPVNKLFCYVTSIKARAGGQRQFALSSNKPLLSPSNIVRAIHLQTRNLRLYLESELDKVQLQKRELVEEGGQIHQINLLTMRIAKLKHSISTPWLYISGVATLFSPYGEIRALSDNIIFLKNQGSTKLPSIKGSISQISEDRCQIIVNGSTIHLGEARAESEGVSRLSVGDVVAVYGVCAGDEEIWAKRILPVSVDDKEIFITGIAESVKFFDNLLEKEFFVKAMEGIALKGGTISVETLSLALDVSENTIRRRTWMMDAIRDIKRSGSAISDIVIEGFRSKFKINGIAIELRDERILSVVQRKQLMSNRIRVRVKGLFTEQKNGLILNIDALELLVASKGNALTLWAEEINRSLPELEKPVSSNIKLADLRDAFITWNWKYRNSWLDAMLAAGHKSKETLNHYLNKRQHKEDSRRDFLKVTNSIWKAIDSEALNFDLELPITIAALTAGATDWQITRWKEGKDKTYVGTGCIGFHNPPKRISPEHVTGQGCKVHRCTLCPHAVLLPDSDHLLARRIAELEHIQSTISISVWADSNYGDELFNTELALQNYPTEQVKQKIEFWRKEILERRHQPMLSEGDYL